MKSHNISAIKHQYSYTTRNNVNKYTLTFLDGSQLDVKPRESYNTYACFAGKMRNAFRRNYKVDEAVDLLEGLHVSNGCIDNVVTVINPMPLGIYLLRTDDDQKEVIGKCRNKREALLMGRVLLRTPSIQLRCDHTQLNKRLVQHMLENECCYLDGSHNNFADVGGIESILKMSCKKYQTRQEKIEELLS